MAKTETSCPSRNCSITTFSPAVPNFPPIHTRAQPCAAIRSSVTRTPFPAASPSAFTTYGPSRVARWATAASASVNVADNAVGTAAAAITSLAKAFEDSSRAAARVGPNTATQAAANASATPAARGASGPMTTRSTDSSAASAVTASASVMSMSAVSPIVARPGLPGAEMSSVSNEL